MDQQNKRMGDKVPFNGNYQYNAYYNGNVVQRLWHKFKIDTAINALNVQNGHHILDAGCGSGMLAAFVAKDNSQVKVTGIDGNIKAIDFCKQHWANVPNANFIQTQIDELEQFEDGTFNGIAFLEVIEHVTEYQADIILKQFYRILKQGGLLIVSTPNRKSLWPVQEKIMDMFKLVPRLKGDQHEKLYSGKELTEIAKKNNLAIVQKQTINFIAPWLGIVSEKFANKIHNLESKTKWMNGSLLLYKFIK